MALQKVTIGFAGGGQVLALRIEETDLEELLKLVKAGAWHDLTVDGGTVRLNLAEVVYVRTDLDEHKVGFGLG